MRDQQFFLNRNLFFLSLKWVSQDYIQMPEGCCKENSECWVSWPFMPCGKLYIVLQFFSLVLLYCTNWELCIKEKWLFETNRDFSCVSCTPHQLHCLCVLCAFIYGNDTEILPCGVGSGSGEEDINQMCNTSSVHSVYLLWLVWRWYKCNQFLRARKKEKLAPRAGRENSRPEQFKKKRNHFKQAIKKPPNKPKWHERAHFF